MRHRTPFESGVVFALMAALAGVGSVVAGHDHRAADDEGAIVVARGHAHGLRLVEQDSKVPSFGLVLVAPETATLAASPPPPVSTALAPRPPAPRPTERAPPNRRPRAPPPSA